MKGNYPHFTENHSREELIEHFMLNETERNFTIQFRGDANRHGVAIWLKSLQYLGYFPSSLKETPTDVKLFIANQLNLEGNPSTQYPIETRTRDNHLAMIRQHTGFRFPTAEDKENLALWLRDKGAFDSYTFADLFESAILRLRSLQIELPAEKELTRVVNAALNGFFYDVHLKVESQISEAVREKIDQLLIVPEDDAVSIFEKVKSSVGPIGLNSRHKELLKDIKHVEGKNQILFRLSEAIMANPDGRICDVIFPVVKPETFEKLIAEKKASGPQYHFLHRHFMKQKYTCHYSRMLPWVLENITFRSDNRFQPIIEALSFWFL